MKRSALLAGVVGFFATLVVFWLLERLPDLRNTIPALTAVVSGFSVGVIVYQVFTLRSKRPDRPMPPETVSNRDREKAYVEVRGLIDRVPKGSPHLDAPHFETAAFLLEEAKAGFERVDSGSNNIESKATSLISIVAGASSALGIFGFTKDGKAVVATPTILAAFAFAVIALIALLYVLRSKSYKNPGIDAYVSAGMVAEDNRVGVALSLAKAYRESRDVLGETIRYEPLVLFIGYVAIATAAGLVLINAATARTDIQSAGGASSGAPASHTFSPRASNNKRPQLQSQHGSPAVRAAKASPGTMPAPQRSPRTR